MPPVTPSHWRGVKVVDKLSSVCPQKLPDTRVPWTFSSFKTPNGPSNKEEFSGSSVRSNKSSQFLPKGRIEYLNKISTFLVNQSEDCLYLNIYLPFSKGEIKFNLL